MKKNLYYTTAFARKDYFFKFFLGVFLLAAAPIRLMLEVFTRKDFGVRYFRFSAALQLVAILCILPFVIIHFQNQTSDPSANAASFLGDQSTAPAPASGVKLMPHYLGWFIFVAAFLGMSVKHKLAQKIAPSVFDFGRFSKSSGNIHPVFFNIPIPMIEVNVRLVECLLEPLPFLIAGVLLALIGQSLGVLLIVCSLFYGLGYCADYRLGDDFIMDKIDEMIVNDELEKSFVDDADPDQTKGFRYRGRKPQSEQLRRKLLPLLTAEDEEIIEAK